MDLRGFGRSQYYNKPDKPAEYTYERWAKDLGVILQWYDLQHVTLVGYSLGGAVAMRYMSGPHPRVENLVLVSAAGPNMHEEVPPPNDMRLAATRMGLGMFADMIGDFDGSDAAFHKFIHLMLPAVKGFDLRDGTNEVEWIKNMFESASHPALIGGLNEMRERDITQGARTISTPSQICYGLFDPFVPFALGKHLHSLMEDGSRDVKFTALLGGHGVFLEQVEELNRALTGERMHQCSLTSWCPVRKVIG